MKADEQNSYYDSFLASDMAEFIRFKRAQGLRYVCEPRRLRLFSRFIAGHGVTTADGLTRDVIDQWCALRPGEKAGTRRLRVTIANQFLAWEASQGTPVPRPTTVRRRHGEGFVPYILSQDELDRFFAAADQMQAKASSVMPETAPVLFRLLYGCGLRISEALNLKIDDVDLDAGCLTIRHAKFDQDRLVPMAHSLLAAMQRHANTRAMGGSRDEGRFFCHRDGRPIQPDTAYRWFREILWSAGISHAGRGIGPRMHDLRHTFAVHSLKHMVDAGMDVYCALPVLSTYLGHSSVTATGSYVRLTQDLFPDIISKTSAISAYVIPGGDLS